MIIKRLTLLIFLSLLKLSFVYAQVVDITGQVLRHNGDPVPNVMVTCSNGDSILTDENGSFEFSELTAGQDYQIQGFLEGLFFEEVSVLDACYNRFMVNQIYNSLTSQDMANDNNQSGLYSGFDFIGIANASVKVENNLTQLDLPWRFFNGNIDENNLNTNEEFLGINLENLSTDTSGLVLLAVKSGDVAIDADHWPPPPNLPQPVFYFSDKVIEEEEEILVSIKARGLVEIMGFQHSLAWDTSYLEFIAYEEAEDIFMPIPNESHIEEGLFPLMKINLNAIFGSEPIADDSTIYHLKFKALQDANTLIGILEFDSLFIPQQTVHVDENGILYLIDTEFIIEENLSTAVNLNPPNLVAFDISPNPVMDVIRFSIQLEKPESSILSLWNINGKILQEQTFNVQTIRGEMNIENLPKGSYYLQLQTEQGRRSQLFIKL